MRVDWALVLLVLRRLALSKSTYRLLGLLLITLGFARGSDVMSYLQTIVCVASGGCED